MSDEQINKLRKVAAQSAIDAQWGTMVVSSRANQKPEEELSPGERLALKIKTVAVPTTTQEKAAWQNKILKHYKSCPLADVFAALF